MDEIPNLKDFNLETVDNEILIFKQKMFYYKFNLYYESFVWFGTKATKINEQSPQWLRNVKNKFYPVWRLDTFFSKLKYNNIRFIENGGWHFTCIKKPKDVQKNYSHFFIIKTMKWLRNMSLVDLENKMKEKKNSL